MASSCCVCGICFSLQITKPAVVWCCDCDDGLCDDCKERHRVSRASKDHQTILVNKYQELFAQVFRFSQICTIHNDKYKIFCKKHDCFCCNRCMIEKHNTCIELESIEDIVKNAETFKKFLEMENSLEEMEKNVSKVFEKLLSNKELIRRDKLLIEKIIYDTREKINNQLDEIQLILIKELADLEEKENQKIDDSIIKLKATEKAVKDYRETLSNIQEYASEFQAFLATKEFEKDIENDKLRLDSICSNNLTQEIHLVFNLSKTIQTFQINAKSFGYVSSEYLPSSSVFYEKQYIRSRPDNLMDEFVLNLVGSFTISTNLLTSCVLLPDGRSAFTCDCEGFLVTKPEGNKGFEISVKPYCARDVTYIPSTKGLASPCNKSEKHCIRIIDTEKQKVRQSIRMDVNYCGICYKDDINSLVVIGGEGIQIINLEDRLVRPVMAQKIPGTPYISTFGEFLYYTINSDVIFASKECVPQGVYCCDLQGTLKWTFSDEKILKCPKGITVDNEGCVYVAGYHSNNVVVLTPGGSLLTVLLSSRNGLAAPTGINYDRSKNQVLVANQSGKAFLYNIKKP